MAAYVVHEYIAHNPGASIHQYGGEFGSTNRNMIVVESD